MGKQTAQAKKAYSIARLGEILMASNKSTSHNIIVATNKTLASGVTLSVIRSNRNAASGPRRQKWGAPNKSLHIQQSQFNKHELS